MEKEMISKDEVEKLFGNCWESMRKLMERLHKKKTTNWICKSKKCASWRKFGSFCKIEVTGEMEPHICPFINDHKAVWEEIREA